MVLEIARLMASQEGKRLYNILQRLVDAPGMSVDKVMKQTADHMERIERLAKRSGFTVKQIEDGSMTLYEAELTGRRHLS